MNKQQKLEAIEKTIRKKFLYLMELTEGCKIEVRENEYYFRNHTQTPESTYITYVKKEEPNVSYSCPIKESKFKIIGHPLKLNDVINWFIVLDENNSENAPIGFDPLKFITVDWNLEKSLLSDQSDDLINFLYETL